MRDNLHALMNALGLTGRGGKARLADGLGIKSQRFNGWLARAVPYDWHLKGCTKRLAASYPQITDPEALAAWLPVQHPEGEAPRGVEALRSHPEERDPAPAPVLAVAPASPVTEIRSALRAIIEAATEGLEPGKDPMIALATATAKATMAVRLLLPRQDSNLKLEQERIRILQESRVLRPKNAS